MRILTKLLVGALLLAGSTALAQPVNDPDDNAAGHRAAGQTNESRETNNETGGDDAKEPADPTRHFNFFGIHYNGKDEYGGDFGDGKEQDKEGRVYEEEPMSAPFVLALVNFALLLVLLAKYGGPFARKTAEDRHDLIQSAIDDAAKLRDQAQHKLGEYEKRIQNVDAEIKALVEGIRADADAERARILAAADAQSAQMKRDAETRIAAEILLARQTLTREVTAAATKAAETLVAQRLTPTDQDLLVGGFIRDLGAGRAPATPATPAKEPS